MEASKSGSFSMDFSSIFQRAVNNTKALSQIPEAMETEEDQEHEKKNKEMELEQHQQMFASSWRLPLNVSIEENERILNQQLTFLSCSSSVMNTSRFLTQGKKEDQLDILQLTKLVFSKDQLEIEAQVRHVMDIVSYLLCLRQRETENHRVLTESFVQLERDVQRKQHQIDQLKVELDTCQNQLAEQEGIFKAKEKQFVSEKKQLTQDKRQLEKMCLRLQSVDTNYKATLKRKEQEYTKLQTQFQNFLQKKSTTSTTTTGTTSSQKKPVNTINSMMMMSTSSNNTIWLNESKCKQNLTNTSSTTSTTNSEQQMLTRMLKAYEQKQSELLFENETLYQSLTAIQQEVDTLQQQYRQATSLFLNQKQAQVETKEQQNALNQQEQALLFGLTTTEQEMDTVKSSKILMNSKQLHDKIHKFHEKIQIFEKFMNEELMLTQKEQEQDVDTSMTHQQQEQQVVVLQEQIQQMYQIIQEQDHLLQKSITLTTDKDMVKLSNELLSQEKEFLLQHQALVQVRNHFEEEEEEMKFFQTKMIEFDALLVEKQQQQQQQNESTYSDEDVVNTTNSLLVKRREPSSPFQPISEEKKKPLTNVRQRLKDIQLTQLSSKLTYDEEDEDKQKLNTKSTRTRTTHQYARQLDKVWEEKGGGPVGTPTDENQDPFEKNIFKGTSFQEPYKNQDKYQQQHHHHQRVGSRKQKEKEKMILSPISN